MNIVLVPVSDAGHQVATTLTQPLQATVATRADVAQLWSTTDAFVFIGAMGVCVRTIAPCVSDKHTDPAVVCTDSLGRSVVSVLSGHVGGANDLARRVAGLLGATPVITTQSDVAGLWPLDTLATRFGWTLAVRSIFSTVSLNECLFAFVGRQPTALQLKVRDAGTDYLEQTLPAHVTLVDDIAQVKADRFKLYIVVSPYNEPLPLGMPTVQYVPRVFTVGVGLAHQAAPAERIERQVADQLSDRGVLMESIREYCTIDLKADEPYVRLLQEQGHHVRFFTASELGTVDVPHPSDTVQKHVGTPSVSEAAAILGSGHGRLVIPKIKGRDFTVAVATDRRYQRQGHIEIVGAGPGAPDLVSVRGRRLIEQADLILYAGSLVPRQLTDCHKPGATVRSSADMALDEQCRLMKQHYDRGHLVVRLHTGDPSLFGAIEEQMAFFDANHMPYHVTPGISSFLAAAAELRSQFTIPGRTQTVILTRGEGRTPMPEGEQLRLLARSRSTMCIFLSAAIVDDVQAQLLEEYPAETPVAVCYHLTWPDQHLYRGHLRDLARIVHDNHLTLTTMIVVGEAIGNREGRSALYDEHFTHLFRKGTD